MKSMMPNLPNRLTEATRFLMGVDDSVTISSGDCIWLKKLQGGNYSPWGLFTDHEWSPGGRGIK